MSQPWQRFDVVLSPSAYVVYVLASQQVAIEMNGLHANPAVAAGQVIELLAADFLAGREGYTVIPLPPHDDSDR